MLSNDSLYLLMLGTGFFGGFGHCIGMCGPLIATYTLTIQASPIERLKPYLIYHSGRIMSYSLIGGFMGLTGSFVAGVKVFSHIQTIAMAFAGILMILTGLSIFKFTTSPVYSFKFFKGIIKIMKGISESGGIGGLFPLGLINGIIPCGLSYTAFIAGAGIGASETNPIAGFSKGMILLLIFGLGTLPSLFLLSQLVSKGAAIIRKRFYNIAGIFMIISGAVFIYRALHTW
ncbi:MAG: sulfite exporter TauE/SafE family protein [Thermodesulfovibrionales bacterium]